MSRTGYWQHSFRADAEREAREDAGDRDCARADFCASATRERLEDGTVKRTAARTYQAFCHTDRSIIIDVLTALPATYARLAAAIGDHFTVETVVRSPFGPSVPLRCDIDELMRLAIDAAMAWRERVADVARLSMAATEQWRRRALNGKAATLLVESVPVLVAHIDVMLGLQREPMARPACSPASKTAEVVSAAGDVVLALADGSDAGLEFLKIDYLARCALLETPAPVVRLLGVPCRECQRRGLRLAPPKEHDSDPDTYSLCVLCFDTMGEPDYRNWVRAWARHYEGRTTPAQMAAAS